MEQRLSNAAHLLQGQPMFKVLSAIKEMERSGRHVVHFEIGEPDFPSPPHVVEAACDALRAECTHYSESLGDYDFREAVRESDLLCCGFKPDIDQILIAPGANMLIYYAVRCLVNPGEDVLITDPCFPTYTSVFSFCGVNPVLVPLKEENGFRLDPDDVRRAITPKTRLIIINSPHNPTGAVMLPEEIEELGRIALEHGVYLYCDDIYARLNYGETPFTSPAHLDNCRDRIIVATGFSKAYAMTGWRLGVCIAPAAVIDKMGLLLQTTSSCVTSFIQKAGIAALQGSQAEVDMMVASYKERRDLLVDGLNTIDGIHCLRPSGAFYIFPSIKGTGLSSAEFASGVLKEAAVGLLPGTDFGPSGEGYVRLCYATAKEEILEGIERIRTFVRDIK